jgi:hypothetical protein
MTKYPTSPKVFASVSDLQWMSGDWIEESDRRRCEEVWSRPDGDTLMGMFRWISEEEVSFFEFMVIKPAETGVELHVKHFHPSLVAWEERDRFQAFSLTELGENRAVFAKSPTPDDSETSGGWITYTLTSDDRLVVELIEANGHVKLTFEFVRRSAA